MTNMQAYKYYIIYALLVLIVGLLVLAVRWPQGTHKTFSQHAAAQKVTIIYYIGLFLVSLPILYLFFSKYFVPHYELSNAVLYLVAISSVAQIGCTLIPETGGIKTTVHQILAGISALLLLAMLAFLLMAPTISLFDRSVIGISITVMLTILSLVVAWKRSPLPELLLQSAYFGVFFIAILFATF